MTRRFGGLCRSSLAALSFAAAGAGHAAGWDESVHGDLSGDRDAPSLLLLGGDAVGGNGEVGHNVVSGRIGRAGDGAVDRDYLTVVVPDGFVWSELRVGQQTQFGGNGSFLGIAAGDSMPVAADATSAAGLLGWRIVGPADRGTSVLDELGASGNGATGFVGPLGAGHYTVWAQELAIGTFAYRYNFVLSPVPDIAARWALVLGGLALLAGALRQRGGAVGARVASSWLRSNSA